MQAGDVGGGAYTGNPNIARQGQRAGVGTRQDNFGGPAAAFMSGLMGTAPDEQSGSVLDPLSPRNSQNAAKAGFGIGTALQFAPIAQAISKAAKLPEHAMEMARKGIEGRMVNSGMIQPATVWHGSPHKFDKFDASKIGTGEGAQAYGHGLYLAEAPEVARTYKSAGADPSTFVPVRSIRDPAQMASTALERAGGDIRHATAVLSQNAQSGDITAGAALQLLKQRAALPESKYAGNMYKVDLPDNAIARMLDWDKPLSQQPKNVQKALAKIPERKIWQEEYEKALPRQEAARAAKDYGSVDFDAADYWLSQINRHYGENATGGQVIGRLKGSVSPVEAAKNLKKLGIPGVRYLDQGSRGAGQGSSNFVIFPGQEGLLQILERNGVPIK